MGRIVRAISKDASVVCSAIDGKDIVSRIEQIHKTSAVCTAGLGRLAMATSLLGFGLKGEKDSITVRMEGGGPAGALICVSDSFGNVRAYIQNPVVELALNAKGKLDVGSYLALSEQVPSVCALGVLVNPDLTVNCAGGFLVQLLPFAPESAIDQIEKNINSMQSVTQMISDGMTTEEIALKALEGLEPNVLDDFKVEYRCDCSRERVEKALISLGENELKDMAKDPETQVECHFCDKKYSFTSQEILKLVESAKKK